MSTQPFPVTRVADISSSDLVRPKWLIEPLWAAAGVGVLGGHPKSCKTWMALDIAISVASATPCLDTFTVTDPGPVLLFLAEDSTESAFERIAGLCDHRGVALDDLDLFLLSTPVLRLDVSDDFQRLVATIERIRPRLLVLDPFVRVQGIDENSASEVSRLLAELTALKRVYDLAILIVHHARKTSAGHPGQALRGSGDLRAWGDTNLFLRLRGDRIELSGEHRYAPSFDPIALKLDSSHATHLAIVGEPCTKPPAQFTLATRVIEALGNSSQPMTRTALRDQLKVNNKRLGDALSLLESFGHTERCSGGWLLSPSFRSQPGEKPRYGTQADSLLPFPELLALEKQGVPPWTR